MKTIFGLPLLGELFTLSSIVCAGCIAMTCFSSFSSIENIRLLEANDREQVEFWNSQKFRGQHSTAGTPDVARLQMLSTPHDPS